MLSKLVVTAITSVVCYIYLTSNTTLYSGVVYPQVSVALVALGSFMVASAFFSVYGMAVDTIFLCFLEDLDHNDGSTERPYYMPDGLASVMGINKAKIINQQAVSQTSQVSSPAAASSVKVRKRVFNNFRAGKRRFTSQNFKGPPSINLFRICGIPGLVLNHRGDNDG